MNGWNHNDEYYVYFLLWLLHINPLSILTQLLDDYQNELLYEHILSFCIWRDLYSLYLKILWRASSSLFHTPIP